MNTATLTALISAVTALIGAVITLVTLLVHIKNHQPITLDKAANSPAKPSLITPPPNTEWPR